MEEVVTREQREGRGGGGDQGAVGGAWRRW